jgi:hypothetical protein
VNLIESSEILIAVSVMVVTGPALHGDLLYGASAATVSLLAILLTQNQEARSKSAIYKNISIPLGVSSSIFFPLLKPVLRIFFCGGLSVIKSF